ncbi:MAG: HAD family hydrolase, partial [Deltaproteobacteria bacterium]|nr:HAD family hydrolase [Deltaproteobacteria bacterium]
AAGIRALGAAWGFRGRAELEAAGADRVLAAPEELLELL